MKKNRFLKALFLTIWQVLLLWEEYIKLFVTKYGVGNTMNNKFFVGLLFFSFTVVLNVFSSQSPDEITDLVFVVSREKRSSDDMRIVKY